MKPVYYPKASSDEGVTMQFDLVCFGEARSMIDQPREQMAARGPSRHIAAPRDLGRFSNRPFEVKHFQTIRHCNVDVAHGLALLFGIGTRALPSWDPRTRWNNLTGGLALPLAGPSDRADSPHPSSREGHHSTAGWSSSFLLSELICQDCHAAGGIRCRQPRCGAG